MQISSKEVFSCNFMDLAEVERLAVRLARASNRGMTVYKHPLRNNYNITFTSRYDRYEPQWVVCQTIQGRR